MIVGSEEVKNLDDVLRNSSIQKCRRASGGFTRKKKNIVKPLVILCNIKVSIAV